MENFNNDASESSNDSDLESVAGENDLLYQFIFGKPNDPNPKAPQQKGFGP